MTIVSALPLLLLVSLVVKVRTSTQPTLNSSLLAATAEKEVTSTPKSSPLVVNDLNQDDQQLFRILITLPVLGMDSLKKEIHCVQLYGGFLTPQDTLYTSDEFLDFEDDLLGHSTHNLPDIHIERLRPFRLRCGMYRLKDFPVDMMVLFPGGMRRNCTEHTAYCQVILAKRSGTSLKLGLSNCFDLYVGWMKIPEEEHLKGNGTMVLEDAFHVGETCNPRAFEDLIQGRAGVDEVMASEGGGAELKLNMKKKILRRLKKRHAEASPLYFSSTEVSSVDKLDSSTYHHDKDQEESKVWAKGVVFNKPTNRTTDDDMINVNSHASM